MYVPRNFYDLLENKPFFSIGKYIPTCFLHLYTMCKKWSCCWSFSHINKKSQHYDMKHTVLAALNRQQQPNHYQNFLTVAGKTINSFLCSSIKVIIYISCSEISLLETPTIEDVFLGNLKFTLNFMGFLQCPSPCGLLHHWGRRRPHGEGVGFWGWKTFWNLKKSSIQLCFMSDGHYWPFSVRSIVSPTQNWLKNATNDISIQDFHNITRHYVKDTWFLPLCYATF